VDEQVKLRGHRIELGEVEAAIGEVEGVRQAVVEVRGEVSGERLVAYVVLDRERGEGEQAEREVIAEVKRRLKGKLPEYMIPSVYVLMKELPLTPSGKLDRRALPLPEPIRPELAQDYAGPRNSVEETLAGIWAAVLRIENVGIHDNFFELGGDSILSLQVIARGNQAGIRIMPKQLFDHPTIAQLSTIVGTASVVEFEQGTVTGRLPLTPIQHLFFEQELPRAEHYNQSTLLEVRKELDAGLMAQAVKHLISHHDALRLRFVREAGGVRQFNAGAEENEVFSLVDLSALEASEQGRAVEVAADELQRSLNLSEGPLMRVALFNLGVGRPGRLLIVIHHLVVDGVSWRVLMDDLYTAYEQLSRGETVQLPSKTTSFKQWAERLSEYAKSNALRQERAYWLAESRRDVKRLPVDYSGGVNTEASARTVSMSFSEDETRALLQEVPAAYHTQINDVLMAGLTQTFLNWTREPRLLVDMEGHGREELIENIDLSRTVGWFTTVFPVLLELEKTSGPGQALKSIKEQLRQIPNRGIGYGLLRYMSRDGELQETLRMFPSPEVCFNYLGQWDNTLTEDSPFVTAQESGGSTRSERGLRTYLLDISGSVYSGQLQMNWTYSENIHQRTTIETLAQNFMEALRAMIAHCQAPEAGGFTPSDFPAANLNQTDLDNFISSLG
jgi:non-ribosomal peptide synthase protein (TIGR01720 family)